jgi:hypothetical protein
MISSENVKQRYLSLVTNLLNQYPEVLRSIEENWQAGRYRHVYLLAERATRENKVEMSPEQRKIDEDFFWDFIN